MSLQINLDKLSELVTVDNQATLRAIFAALSKSEYLLPDTNQYITRKINRFLPEHPAYQILTEINTFLTGKFQNRRADYVPGNPECDTILAFLEKIDHFAQESLLQDIARRFSTLTELLNEIRSREKYYSSFDHHLQQYQHYSPMLDSSLIYPVQECAKQIKDDKARAQALSTCQDISCDLISEKMGFFLDCGIALSGKMDIEKTRGETDTIHHLFFDLEMEVMDLYFRGSWENKESNFSSVLANLAYLSSFIVSSQSLQSEHYLQNQTGEHKISRESLIRERPPLPDEIEKYLTIPDHRRIVRTFDLSDLGSSAQNNVLYNAKLMNLDQASLGLIQYLNAKGKNSGNSPEKESLLAAFHLLNRYRHTDFLKEIQEEGILYVYFFNKQIAALKKLTLSAEDDIYKKDLFKAIEYTLINLWYLINGVFSGEESALARLRMSAVNINTPSLELGKQRLLIFMTELVAQMYHFNIEEFNSPSTTELINLFLNQEKPISGLGGLCDLLLNRINASDVSIQTMQVYQSALSSHIFPIMPIQPQPFVQIQAAEIKAAEEAYQSLLLELEVENRKFDEQRKLIQEEAQRSIKRQKEKYKNAVNKKSFNKNKFFPAAPQTPAPSLSLAPMRIQTPQADHYYTAAKLRQDGAKFEDILKEYDAIIKPEDKDLPVDHFYHAAALAEISDCYFRKGLSELCSDIKQLGPKELMPLILLFNKAVGFAKQADNYFLDHVTKLNSESLDDYEALAAHIHEMLTKATQQIESLQAQFGRISSNLRKKRDALDKSRAQALSNMGVIQWLSNPAPKNYFATLRKETTESISALESSNCLLKSLLKDKLEPIKSDFGYLIGNERLPLLLMAPQDELTQPSDNPVLYGGGQFDQRLQMLATAEKELAKTNNASKTLALLSVPPVLMLGDGSDECNKAFTPPL